MTTISSSTTLTTAYQVTGDTTGALVFQTGATPTTAMTIDGSQNVGIGTSSPTAKLHVEGSSGITTQIIKSTASVAARINMQTTNDLNGYLNYDTGVWKFFNDSAGTPTERMRIDSSGNVGIGGSAGSGVRLDVQTPNGTAAKVRWLLNGTDDWTWQIPTTGSFTLSNGTTERLRVDGSGNLLVGQSSAGSIRGTSQVQVYNGTVLRSSDSFNGIPCVTIYSATDTTNGRFASFTNSSGTEVGSITRSGASTTAYNTSSDYRLKENVYPMTGALSAVQQLKPCTYTWKADGSSGQGFIAHELQEVVPDCVTGEKDAVDADGNPVYQGIDTSFLVATLTAAIQEQQAIIQQLTARIETLEAK